MKIYNSFIQCNFNYCPVVYNTYSMQLCRKLEKIQERALRFVFNDFSCTYRELLDKAEKPSLIQMRAQATVEQVYKVINNQAPPMPSDFFKKYITPYSTRRAERLIMPSYNTVTYGKNSFRYIGSQLWNLLPNEIVKSKDIFEFKNIVKTWEKPKCHCGFCHECGLHIQKIR